MEETHVATSTGLPRESSKRLDDIGWALFLIMIGAIWLMPAGSVPEGTWLLGAGIILLGMNGVRVLRGVKMSGFGIALGVLALAAGLGGLAGVKVPIFAILFILIGASLLLRPLLRRKTS